MACYGGIKGMLIGLTKSTDHPSTAAPHEALTELDGKIRTPVCRDTSRASQQRPYELVNTQRTWTLT